MGRSRDIRTSEVASRYRITARQIIKSWIPNLTQPPSFSVSFPPPSFTLPADPTIRWNCRPHPLQACFTLRPLPPSRRAPAPSTLLPRPLRPPDAHAPRPQPPRLPCGHPPRALPLQARDASCQARLGPHAAAAVQPGVEAGDWGEVQARNWSVEARNSNMGAEAGDSDRRGGPPCPAPSHTPCVLSCAGIQTRHAASTPILDACGSLHCDPVTLFVLVRCRRGSACTSTTSKSPTRTP